MDEDKYDEELRKKLEAALPCVGLYIAAASAVCTLAMAADAFNGFRRKKPWFPSKYFSLNATSLTLLSVAMKLPMDLTTIMIDSDIDAFAKYLSLIFMSTALANFMSSLGSMSNKEVLANVVALGILVFTITGDVFIQLIRLRHFVDPLAVKIFIMFPTILMLLSLVTLVSLAITVPTTKRSLESKYQEKHRVALREQEALKRREAFKIDDQRRYMVKYLVMAESSGPQFVMARSVVCSTSAVMCLFAAIMLAKFHIQFGIHDDQRGESPYRYYTKWILYIQLTGVEVGTIAPALRWLVVVSFRCSTTNWNSFRRGFKIEDRWTQTLVEWRDSFSALQIRQNQYRKYLHDVKWFALTFCIGVQILIVLVSKLIVFFSTLLVSPFFLCFTLIKKFVKRTGHEASGDADLNFSRYVLVLEGEPELPRRVVKNICREAGNIIKKGRKKQPKSLMDLLNKSVNFNGVSEFDRNQIPSLHSQEPPNCWALPIVTLTSIAIALPNIAKHKSKQLLSSVGEGLSLAKIVEETSVQNAELVNIRKAADICWVGVVLYTKWLDTDLKRTSLKCKNSKAVLQELSRNAEGIVMEFKKDEHDPIMENPLDWPAKVVAANSMYRIIRTILLSCEEAGEFTDEGLFERLSVIIADILAACLTNLPYVIRTMCHHNAIETRDKIVRKAFLLLGKTEQVLELLQQREWPYMDNDKAACIEEWRALFRKDHNEDVGASTSSAETVIAPVSSEEQLAIAVDC